MWRRWPLDARWLLLERPDKPVLPYARGEQVHFLGLHGTSEESVRAILTPGHGGSFRLLPGPASHGWGDVVCCAGFVMPDGVGPTHHSLKAQIVDRCQKVASTSKHRCGLILVLHVVGHHHGCSTPWEQRFGAEPGHIKHYNDGHRSWTVHTRQAEIHYVAVDTEWSR